VVFLACLVFPWKTDTTEHKNDNIVYLLPDTLVQIVTDYETDLELTRKISSFQNVLKTPNGFLQEMSDYLCSELISSFA